MTYKTEWGEFIGTPEEYESFIAVMSGKAESPTVEVKKTTRKKKAE